MMRIYTAAITYLVRLVKVVMANLVLILMFSAISQSFAQGTWTPLANQPPDSNLGVMIILSDGSVICKTASGGGDSYGNTWDKLTPDSNGSYINGTWKQISPMNDTRLYFASQVMKDGRVFVAGGEYGTGGYDAEIYDPVADNWQLLPQDSVFFGDANSEILPDGRILLAELLYYPTFVISDSTVIFDPLTNTWSRGPTCHGGHDESAWVKLRDSSILFINYGTRNSERYIPSLNQWRVDAVVPDSIYDGFLSESGGGLLLPDGRAFFLGSTGHTAYYTPSNGLGMGSWAAGPDIPNGYGTTDAPAAMMVNGKIIFTASPVPIDTANFNSPTAFFEFDYQTNSITQISAPGGVDTLSEPCFQTNLVLLPDGNVLYGDFYNNQYYVYSPGGAPLAAGKPTINHIQQVNCSQYYITGTLFNGISEGASYGDDWQMATNYPLVRLTSGNKVYYARTHDWNSTGVQRGNLPDTAQFAIPASIPSGNYSLVVVANGISSNPIQFQYSQGTAITISANGPTTFCNGGSVLLTGNTGTGIWNTGATAANALPVSSSGDYYVKDSNQCGNITSNHIAVTVNPLPNVAFSGLPLDSGCQTGKNDTLTGSPPGGTFTGHILSSNIFSPALALTGWNRVSYTYLDTNGCINTFIDSAYIENCASISEVNGIGPSFVAYPNPTDGLLHIKANNIADENLRISLTNISGQILSIKEIISQSPDFETDLNMQNLNKGIYFLIINSDKQNQVLKVQKL